MTQEFGSLKGWEEELGRGGRDERREVRARAVKRARMRPRRGGPPW